MQFRSYKIKKTLSTMSRTEDIFKKTKNIFEFLGYIGYIVSKFFWLNTFGLRRMIFLFLESRRGHL